LKRILVFALVLQIAIAETYAPDILDRTSGLEHIGAGYTGVARPFTISAPYWNPAGLFLLDKQSVGFNYYKRLEEVSHVSVDGFYNYDPNLKLGFNFVQEEIADIPKTADVKGEGVRVGSFSDTYRMYNLAVATRLQPGLYGGLNAKFLTRDIAGYSASGYGFDLGLVSILDERTSFGLNLKNIISGISWSTSTQEMLERKIAVGVSHKSQLIEKDFFVDLDYEFYTYDSTLNAWFLGCEHWFIPKQMAWRAGMNAYKQLTFGLGFYYYDFKADFAYIMKDEYFKDMLLFSLGFDFRLNQPKAAEEITEADATPEQNYLKDYKLEEEQLIVNLENIAALNKIAVIGPDKEVVYFNEPDFASANIKLKSKGTGEYVFFYQQKDGKIYKQRISL